MNGIRLSIGFFKFFEFLCCVNCLRIHIIGYTNEFEVFYHDILFCGTYFAYLLTSILGFCAVLFGVSISILMEAILNSAAFILFLSTSIVSMVDVENDEHLMFLTDSEELTHEYFVFNKAQSMFSLFTAVLFALHAFLMWDAILVTQEKPGEVDLAVQPLRMENCLYHSCVRLQSITCCKNSLTRLQQQHPNFIFDKIV